MSEVFLSIYKCNFCCFCFYSITSTYEYRLNMTSISYIYCNKVFLCLACLYTKVPQDLYVQLNSFLYQPASSLCKLLIMDLKFYLKHTVEPIWRPLSDFSVLHLLHTVFEKFTVCIFPRSSLAGSPNQNVQLANMGHHFTLMFCRRWLRNLP